MAPSIPFAEARGGALRVARISAPAPPVTAILGSAGAGDRPFVLASGPGDPELSAWSYAGLEPSERIRTLAELPRALAHLTGGGAGLPEELPPFTGGAVGYVGYDMGWTFAPRPRAPRPDPVGMPALSFSTYDAIYARNERTLEGWVIGRPDTDGRRRAERLAGAIAERRVVPGGHLTGTFAPQIPRRLHLERVRAALELIQAGELYQVNLTYPLEGRFEGAPAAAFLRLVSGTPPPFSALLAIDPGQWLLSASPECLFDFDASTRAISTYPIKGTRRRAEDLARDRALAEELVLDEKERAEHLMIVDLLRNDLGRFASFGSVRVPRLCYVESFPGVHHLTSRIVGLAPAGVGLAELLASLFPGGSITGAPKLRAMEVIDALEGDARGAYTGAIAYVTPEGSARASVAIRTAQIAGGMVRFGVGGGIVADSIPESEWAETELKAKVLTAALRG